jgi:hypothetical protein
VPESILFLVEFFIFSIDLLFFFSKPIFLFYRSLLAITDIVASIVDLLPEIGCYRLSTSDDILGLRFCSREYLVTRLSLSCLEHEVRADTASNHPNEE